MTTAQFLAIIGEILFKGVVIYAIWWIFKRLRKLEE